MKKHTNYFLLFWIICVLGFSFLFFACLSAPASLQRFGNSNYFLFHQILLGLLPGAILGFILYKVPIKTLKRWAPMLFLVNFIVMFGVLLPGIGTKAGGASRWMDFGFVTFQPAEFLKLTAILYLAAWIASKLFESNASDWKSITKKGYHNAIQIFFPFTIFLGLIVAAFYLQSDASTLGVIALTLLALYFSAKTPLWHSLLIIASGATLFLLLIRFEPYRLDRWLIFLHPDVDPLGKGFQLRQSLISLGSGGVFGRGLGMSTQKFGFLPQAMTDSLFAIFGEELGIFGSVGLVVAFILFFWVALKIAKKSNDRFSKMVAVGIAFWITFQAFINIASVAGLFPLTGIPLPFFSYGGSHLVTELAAMGILLNISKNT